MYPVDEQRAPKAPDSAMSGGMRSGVHRPVHPASHGLRRPSEGDGALDHEALELATVADVGRGEVLVVLPHELELREHVRGDEPAATGLVALDRDVVRDAGQLAVHRVNAAAEVELVAGEAIQAFANQLAQGAAIG